MSMSTEIPQFPAFKKLDLTLKDQINSYIKRYDPYSDFNFVSMYSYDTHERIAVSRLNDNLVIQFTDYISGEVFFTFLGSNRVTDTARKLLDAHSTFEAVPELRMIPEANVDHELQAIGKEFHVVEDVNNHDYILASEELANLTGKKYYDKRNLVNRFRRLYPDHVFEIGNLQSDVTRHQLDTFFNVWQEMSHRDPQETFNEHIALDRLLDAASHFDLLLFKVLVHGELVGFSISEPTHNNYVVVHFEKLDRRYQGASSYLIHKYAQYYHEKGYKHINYEQDLGIANLRKAKSLLRPTHFLKKYIISPMTS